MDVTLYVGKWMCGFVGCVWCVARVGGWEVDLPPRRSQPPPTPRCCPKASICLSPSPFTSARRNLTRVTCLCHLAIRCLHNATLLLGPAAGTGPRIAVLRNRAVRVLGLLLLLLFLLLLGVQLQGDGARLLHVEQLLEQFGHVVVRLCRRLHEGYAPGSGLRLTLCLGDLQKRRLRQEGFLLVIPELIYSSSLNI